MLASSTKQKIRTIVKAYAKEHPEDYRMVKEAIEAKRKLNADEFASVQGSQLDMRALFEIPEALYTDLIIGLSEDEFKEFKSVPSSRWFAKEFPAFALPKTI